MASDQLHITIVQHDIVWENKGANLLAYEEYIQSIQGKKEVVVLPEMFSTGFSMDAAGQAETMDGPTVQWMLSMAATHRCIITGSLIIEEGGLYYNRLLWVLPNGQIGTYDKRHLFGYAEEDQYYAPGDKRLIVSVNGWKICPLICYDLRFPVWARNTPSNEYDVLIYVANWPERRSLAWRTLLQARAIENMAYVVGVNRVGVDGKDIPYIGESSVFGPLGEPLWQGKEAGTHTVILEKSHLEQSRKQFPFINDADKFMLLD
jgi:predicted amidohydrolase